LNQFARPSPAMMTPISTAKNSAPISGRVKASESGKGATKWLSSTRTGVTNSAIWIELPMAIPTARSILSLRAMAMAAPLSAAPPRMASKMMPMNVEDMPSA
jgi:hypothetical protein